MSIENFPDFISLDDDNRSEYESLIAGFTQYSNFSYPSMKIWYDQNHRLKVSRIENGVVIFYDNSDPRYQGYSVLGEGIEPEILSSVLEFSKDQGYHSLVHLPSFAISKVMSDEHFEVSEEGEYDEYLIDAAQLASLESSEIGKVRRKVGRFKRETMDRRIDIETDESIDSSLEELILVKVASWDSKFGRENDTDDDEGQALRYSLKHFSELGLKLLTLKIDDELYGFCIYGTTIDGSQYILSHLRTDYSIPFINEFVTHIMARIALENSVRYLNLEMDLGIDNLKYHKMSFRPVILKQYQLTNKKSGSA